MAGRERDYKITGERTDPYIISLVHPNNHIFRKARIVNVRKGDKKPLAAELVLDQKSHGLLFNRRETTVQKYAGL